ncbi:MAG: PD-(D/E)XK nuclease family protein [Peptostreptococcaceae bacterium]
MNIVKLLGIMYKEDIISNFIVGLINESPSFRNSFIKNIVEIENPEDFKVEAHTRVATSVGIPDIVISMEKEDKSILLIIENKLKADEGCNQTLRYSDNRCISDLINNKKIFNKENVNIECKFMFLTLIPEQSPTGDEFINITYKHLIDKVNAELEDPALSRIYVDFIEVLKEFYDGLDINKNDNLIETLNQELDSSKAFIKFKRIFGCIESINGLSIDYIGKAKGAGRISFIAKISKDSWKGEEKITIEDGKYRITKNSYDIHLEPSFDIFNKSISLPLHYEPRPYIPKNKLIENSSKEEYDEYINKREITKKLIHNKINQVNDKNIKVYNGSNQIASIKLDINEDMTIGEFINMVEKYMRIVSEIVDSCF